MRVLVVGFTYLVGPYQSKLTALSGTGSAEVALLCPSKWTFPEWNRTFVLEAHRPGFSHFPADVWFLAGRQGAFLYPVRTIVAALREFRPDIIYLEHEVAALAAFEIAVMARLFRIPLAVFCWQNMERPIDLARTLTRKFVLRSARLITPGNVRAAHLLRQWGYVGPMEVLPEVGFDSALFVPSSHPLEGRPFAVGFVGRIVYEKGISTILDAARLLIDAGHLIQIVICGTGNEEANLREHASGLGISGVVEWLGEVRHERVPDAMRKMDVLVLPSRTIPRVWAEQFGHVLIEAMAMRIPVLGSSSGAIPDVLGREDLVFTEGDSLELASRLARLLTDRSWRAEVAEYGYRRAHQEFSNEQIAQRVLMLFNKVLLGEQTSL